MYQVKESVFVTYLYEAFQCKRSTDLLKCRRHVVTFAYFIYWLVLYICYSKCGLVGPHPTQVPSSDH